MIGRIAAGTMLAGGWRRALLAVSAGAAGALAMPPFGLWPVLLLSFPVAVWLIDGADTGHRHRLLATLWRAAWTGWLWGLGYFVAGLWWLGAAFLVEADQFAWLMPFGVLGLPAYLAIYTGFGFAVARLLWSPGPWRLFAFALGMTVGEWLRGHLLTGFPWNGYGLALGQGAWLMQSASVVGMYGLTAIATLLLATPATLGTGAGRERAGPVTAAALGLAAMALFGALRLPSGPVADVPGVKLRIMQPNLAQDAKFRPSNGSEILNGYLALSDRATSPGQTGLGDVTHLIWPESAFPFLLAREPKALSRIAEALGPGTTLLTGAARREDGEGDDETPRYFNAIQAVNGDGAVIASYDKVHLVPFGEYVPGFFDAILGALHVRQFVNIPGGFSPGSRHATLRVPGLPPVDGAVCYEAIFPDEVASAAARPGLILNVTNDGWFGDTPGPRQHFAQARLRAVEQGLPLVRAANTGISAVVDPYGRVVASLPVGRTGVLDSALPVALAPTLFARFGELGLVGLCILYGGFAFLGLRRRA